MEIDTSLRMQGQWSGELVGRHKNGDLFQILGHITAVRDRSNMLTHYIAVFSDLTAVRNAEQKLFHLAHHDPLTGLPNRLLARERLERSLERAKRLQLCIAVLFIDLDYFKRVNDALGHNTGDDLLRTVARRMQACIRSEDTVSREGGDEFVVVLDHIEGIEDAVTVAGKIIHALNQPVRIETIDLHISASIGISIAPDNGSDPEGLISAADAAMYVAKEQGKSRWAFYSAEMTARTAKHMALDQELRRALQQDEFVLHYQPQFSMRTGSMVGVEALIRWQHPQKGLLGADDIIPIAEDNGLIIDIGDWVLRRACGQAREWRESGIPQFRIAVNVSARQMHDKRFIQAVREAVDETGMPPDLLEVEITESTLQSGSNFLASLGLLKELGVLLAIDDFGTGYSCLGSLKHLPIDRVKIDRVFVRDMEKNANDVAITSAIIAMAHRLQMKVVAEGVETAMQAKLLDMRDCDEAQGYLYAKPLPPSYLAAFLHGQGRKH
jgi:diguanylate cyclase (GGDEF)-like protein